MRTVRPAGERKRIQRHMVMKMERFEYELRKIPFRKLRGAIVAYGWNQEMFGKAMAWTKSTVSERLNGKRSWPIEDVYRVCEVLDIDPKDIPEYWPREDVDA